MRLKKIVRQQAEKLLDMEYIKRRRQCRLDYAEWLKGLEQQQQAEEDDREWEKEPDPVLLAFEAGSWAPDAAQRIRRFLAKNPEVQLVYGDEDVCEREGDKICKKRYEKPWLKPCWSPDSYLCRDYLGSAVAVRRSLYDKLTEEERRDMGACHDRLVQLAGGFEKGCIQIAHMTGILYHRHSVWPLPGEGRPGVKLEERGAEAAEKESGFRGETAASGEEVEVSVVIPSKDNAAVLIRCLDTLCQTVRRLSYEIILVDNGSGAQAREMIAKEVEKLKNTKEYQGCLKGIQVIYQPMEFNFSRMCNMGAAASKGGFLLFLNDDIEAVEPGWLEGMVEKAKQPWVGAVGYKLLYPDGEKIQHAGVTNIILGPTHKLQHQLDCRTYYDGRSEGIWNMLAVTGACLLLRREVFDEVEGFCEEMKVAFNDVDLCFKIYEKGYHNVVINEGHLLHHESLSRGLDETEEKHNRLMGEYYLLFDLHPQLKSRDPYYHPWLNGTVQDTAIKPAYLEGAILADPREYEPAEEPINARLDDCLMFRVEYADKKEMYGYAVVLGSDNACFTKKLLFRSVDSPDKLYGMDFTDQYRSDLEMNLPDQKNVGLCGYRISFAKPLPPGEYKVGLVARDRISGMTLINWNPRNIRVFEELEETGS